MSNVCCTVEAGWHPHGGGEQWRVMASYPGYRFIVIAPNMKHTTWVWHVCHNLLAYQGLAETEEEAKSRAVAMASHMANVDRQAEKLKGKRIQ